MPLTRPGSASIGYAKSLKSGAPNARRSKELTDQSWEDDLDHPRHADELVPALQSTWTIVEDCLTRWTPEMLQDEFRREINGQVQIHTRQGVLMRLLTHDAYHIGEITQTLGVNGLPEIYIWTSRVLSPTSS